MANGDAAAAQGWDLVAGTADRRNGWDEINKSRDYSALTKTGLEASLAGKAPTSHNHSAAQVTSGTLDPARIPGLDASKIVSGTFTNARTTATASNTPNSIIARNADGVASVSDPTAASHIATRGWVQGQLGTGGGGSDGPTSAAYNRGATGSGWYQTWMNSSLQFMRNTSSERYKQHIRPLDDALAGVLALDPVTFEYRADDVDGRFMGLLAEAVADVFPEVVTFDDEGRPDAIDYGALVAPLIGAVRELTARVAALEAHRDDG